MALCSTSLRFGLEGMSRTEALAEAERVATERAVEAGANERSIEIVEREDHENPKEDRLHMRLFQASASRAKK